MILKGNLLVADPKMFQDYNFRRSVIVLVDHNSDGTVGFVLNKQLLSQKEQFSGCPFTYDAFKFDISSSANVLEKILSES